MADGQTLIVQRRTKLHRPRLPVDLVERSTVLARLNRYQRRPLTLVSAPAGYGKSTLVSSWIEQWARHYAWLSLDEQDNDLHQFLSYLLAALQKVFPTVGQELQSLLAAADLPPTSTLANLLSNELDQCPEEFILVLDDYHFIHNTDIHDLLSEVLRYPPAPLHLFITTRRDPPLPLSSLRAQGYMTEVRAKDLRFSVADTSQFLRLALDEEIDDQIAVTLEAQTEGWIAGLQMASVSLREQGETDQFEPGLQDNRYLMDYLVTEVLSRQPAPIQDYLLTTAILDRFCAALCEAVHTKGLQSSAQDMSGQEFIAWLEDTHLFVIPLDNQGGWFRYHHLFQKLLQDRVKDQHSPDAITELHKRASAWFADNNVFEEAFQHALASGDATVAAQLIVQHRHDVVNQELWAHIDRWLRLLPTDIIAHYPELLILEAWTCQSQHRLSEMATILDKIETQLEATPSAVTNPDHVLGEADALRSFQYYDAADGSRAVFHAERALQRLPSQYLSARGFAVIINAAAHQMIGQQQSAESIVRDALQHKKGYGSTYHARLLNTLCYIHWVQADLPRLQQAAQQYLDLGEQFNLPETATIGKYFLGIYHYHSSRPIEAAQHLAPLVQGNYIPRTAIFIHITFALALAYQDQGFPDKANEVVKSLISHLTERENSALLLFAQAFQIELALQQGRVPEASSWARHYAPGPLDPMYQFYVPQITWAKTLLAQKSAASLKKAESFLSRYQEFAEGIHNTRLLIEVLALQAQLHNALGDGPAACADLQRLIALARPGGLLRLFTQLRSELIQLLPQLDLDADDLQHAEKLTTLDLKEDAYAHVEVPTLPPPVIQVSQKQPLDDALTDRELEVMGFLAQRMSNKEIASQLFISAVTVKRHTINIYQKLDVNSRRQAVTKAKELGLLAPV